MPGLFAEDIGEITAAFEEVWTRRGDTIAALMHGEPRRPHTGDSRSFLVPFIDQSERLAQLLDDPRLEGTVASLCGGDFNYTGGDGNQYSGDTQWHSDGHTADKSACRFVKCAWCDGRCSVAANRLASKLLTVCDSVEGLCSLLCTMHWCCCHRYLDPLTADTGALRVIPGSHFFGDAFAAQLQRTDVLSNGTPPIG